MRTFTAVLVFVALATGLNCAPADHVNSDFQTLNEEGGYHFGFNDGHQARQELRSPDGVVRGAYTYVDANGEIQLVTYTADDHNGFLVSGTNVPQVGVPEVTEEVVQETPEVAAARAQHLEAVRSVQLGGGDSDSVVVAAAGEEIPEPVPYTPEVAEARAAHFNAHAEAAFQNRAAARGVSSPTWMYIIPSSHFHPDYLPYAYL